MDPSVITGGSTQYVNDARFCAFDYDVVNAEYNFLKCGYTDFGGNYNLSGISSVDPDGDGTGIDLRMDIRSDGSHSHVLDASDNIYGTLISFGNDITSSMTDVPITLHGTTLSKAFWINDAIADGRKFFHNRSIDINKVDVGWQYDNGTQAFEIPGRENGLGGYIDGAFYVSNKIYLDGDSANTGDDSRERHTILHEWGHHTMNDTFQTPLPPCGGSHYIPFQSPECLAWYEGWAQFIPHFVDNIVEYQISDNEYYNIEEDWYSSGGIQVNLTKMVGGLDVGHQVEGHVAGALWDIYDVVGSASYDMRDGVNKDTMYELTLEIVGVFDKDPLSFLAFYKQWVNDYPSSSIDDVMYLHYMGFLSPVTSLDDDFQTGSSNWLFFGDDNWQRSLADVDFNGHSRYTNYVLESSDCDNYCDMTLIPYVALTSYTNPELNFWRFIDSTIGVHEGLLLQVSGDGGATWDALGLWTNTSSDIDSWTDETVDLSAYNTSDAFKLRFTGISDGSSEDVKIDDVVIRESPSLLSFDDDFESGLSGWTLSGDDDWITTLPGSQSHPNVPNHPLSNDVADAQDCDSTCTMTISDNVDLTSYNEAYLGFWRLVDTDALSALNEGLRVYGSGDGGSTWTEIDNFLASNGENDGIWHYENYDLSSYLSSDKFKVKFDGISNVSYKDMLIDDVSIGDIADDTAPAVSITYPSDNSHTASTSIPVYGTASDADTGIRSVTVSLDGGSQQGATGTTSWSVTLSNLSVGTHTITATATNGAGLTSTDSVSVTVTASNTAPVLEPIPIFRIPEESTLEFTANATDADGDSLTFSLADGESGTVPPGAAITPDGAFSWTLSGYQNGLFSFDVVVTDDGSPNLEDSDTVVVLTYDPDSSSPPRKVTNLSVPIITSSSVLVNWDAPSNIVANAIPSPTEYDLQRQETLSPGYSTIATVPFGTTSYSDDGVSDDTSYDYKVRAKNGNGYGEFSDPANAVTPSSNGSPVVRMDVPSEVDEGALGILDGSRSYDPDGDSLTFFWNQTDSSGTVATLSSPTSAITTFAAPLIPANTTLTFQLSVSDSVITANGTADLKLVNIPLNQANLPRIPYPFTSNSTEFGTSVALDDAGTLLAVGAPLQNLVELPFSIADDNNNSNSNSNNQILSSETKTKTYAVNIDSQTDTVNFVDLQTDDVVYSAAQYVFDSAKIIDDDSNVRIVANNGTDDVQILPSVMESSYLKEEEGENSDGSGLLYLYGSSDDLLATIPKYDNNNNDDTNNNKSKYVVLTSEQTGQSFVFDIPTGIMASSPAYNAGVVIILNATDGTAKSSIPNPYPGDGDYFGSSVAFVDSDKIVIGAYFDDVSSHNEAGQAFIYSVDGTKIADLTAQTVASSDNFGHDVASDGSKIVVGAPEASGGGTATVFDTSGSLLQTLSNPASKSGDDFGKTVAISDSYVVVGAPFDDTVANGAGTVYLFDKSSYVQQRQLTHANHDSWDYFGRSVAADDDDDLILVGASGDEKAGYASGSAYVFDGTTGTLQSGANDLVNPDPDSDDRFGYAVAFAGDYLAVGAYKDDNAASDAGAVYVFNGTDYSHMTSMENPEPDSGGYYGISLSGNIFNNLVFAGAPYNDNSGVSYLYTETDMFPPNAVPMAFAGANQTVTEQTTVTLDGSSSYDGDGDALSYSWSQTDSSGYAVTFSDSSSASPTFAAPDVGTSTDLTFDLTVNDGTDDSAPDGVTVTVEPVTITIPNMVITNPANNTVFIENQMANFTGVAYDAEDGIISSLTNWYSDIDGFLGTGNATSTSALSLGNHTITANVTDSSSRVGSDDVAIMINAIPVITLLGNNTEYVELNLQNYTDAGATAYDLQDGNLTGSIMTVNPVDESVLGNYTVTYNVQDSKGANAIQQNRTVTVRDATSPVITLNGANPQVIPMNSTYVELGAHVTDNDPAYSDTVMINSTDVDTSTVGQYLVTYDAASDPSGNAVTSVSRIVDVVIPRIYPYDMQSNGTNQNSQHYSPRVVTFDGAGKLYVAYGTDNTVEVFENNSNNTETFSFAFGSVGTGQGQFDYPAGIAVDDSTGRIYVADQHNHRIQVFNETGHYLSEFGSKGTGPSQLTNPASIALDETAGKLYVADRKNYRVEVFNATTGGYLSEFGSKGAGQGQFGKIAEIAFDGTGLLHVADPNNHRIQTFNSTTNQFVSEFGSMGRGDGQFIKPRGITFDAADNMYVIGTDNRLQIFNGTDSYSFLQYLDSSDTASAMGSTPSISLDPSGNIYVADSAARVIHVIESMYDVSPPQPQNVSCSVPQSGDWMITRSCVLAQNATAPANIMIQNNSTLTIPDGVTLTVNSDVPRITVEDGSDIAVDPSWNGGLLAVNNNNNNPELADEPLLQEQQQQQEEEPRQQQQPTQRQQSIEKLRQQQHPQTSTNTQQQQTTTPNTQQQQTTTPNTQQQQTTTPNTQQQQTTTPNTQQQQTTTPILDKEQETPAEQIVAPKLGDDGGDGDTNTEQKQTENQSDIVDPEPAANNNLQPKVVVPQEPRCGLGTEIINGFCQVIQTTTTTTHTTTDEHDDTNQQTTRYLQDVLKERFRAFWNMLMMNR